MTRFEEIVDMLDKHKEHCLSLDLVARHLQNKFTTFFDQPQPLSYWKRVLRSEIKQHADVLVLTPDLQVQFNPDRAVQLSLDFSEEESPKKEAPDLFQGSFFDE